MKYPQLVRMPSAVQDWLHEQLEARGIDAVVYGRYILSLLQRDTLDLAEDFFSVPSKEKESCHHSHKKSSSSLGECWNVSDSEQLKRSAAVECLMSASRQKFGIEKLIDELCIKLNEAQNKDVFPSELSLAFQQSSILSAPSSEDHFEEFHAACPPLNNKSSKTFHATGNHSIWNERNELKTTSKREDHLQTVGNLNQEHSELGNEDSTNLQVMKYFDFEKGIGFGFASMMAAERNSRCLDFSSGEDSGNEATLAFHRNHEKRGDSMCRRLYERQTNDADESFYSGLVEDTEDFYGEHIETSESSKQQNADDSNLAQLIAKFDHSIEALWNPDEVPTDDSSEKTGLISEKGLAVDINRILSSPEEDCLAMELVDLNIKRQVEQTRPQNNCFIQCGTNILSSIWSEQPTRDIAVENADFRAEVSNLYMKATKGENVAEKVKPKIPSFIFDGKRNLKTESQTGPRSSNNDRINELFKSLGNSANESKTLPFWNTGFPSFFASNLSWNLDNSAGDIKHRVGSVWSNLDKHSVNVARNNYRNKHNMVNDPVLNDSYILLNHNKEHSSFTEVVPKQNFIQDAHSLSLDLNPFTRYTINDNTMQPGLEKEEEDLLTSTRTHFCPINRESVQESSQNNVSHYEDGTTFVIHSKLDDVNFKRSESGSLYLESDTASGGHRRYMEYKEKEPYGGRRYGNLHLEFQGFVPKFKVRDSEKYCQTEDTGDDAAISDDEVDTKRSRQEFGDSDEFFFPGDDHLAKKVIDHTNNEHCPSETSRSVRRSLFGVPKKQDSIFLQSNFLNSGGVFQMTDLTLQCKITEVSSMDLGNDDQADCKCDNSWKDGWLNNLEGDGKTAWYNASDQKNLSHAWYDIWRVKPEFTKLCDSCSTSRAVGAPSEGASGIFKTRGNVNSMQHTKLREELCEDGEQLLSDLSYLRLCLGSDMSEESVIINPQVNSEEEESVALLKVGDEYKNEVNERPFSAKATPKDRKRRHSATQKEISLPQEMAGIPCQISMDVPCLKGIVARPFFCGGTPFLRPVTL